MRPRMMLIWSADTSRRALGVLEHLKDDVEVVLMVLDLGALVRVDDVFEDEGMEAEVRAELLRLCVSWRPSMLIQDTPGVSRYGKHSSTVASSFSSTRDSSKSKTVIFTFSAVLSPTYSTVPGGTAALFWILRMSLAT